MLKQQSLIDRVCEARKFNKFTIISLYAMWRGKGSGRRCSRQWHWWKWYDSDDWWQGNDDWWHGNDDGWNYDWWQGNDDWWHGNYDGWNYDWWHRNDGGNHSDHLDTISDGRETLQVHPQQQVEANAHPSDTKSDEIILAEQDQSHIDPCCFQQDQSNMGPCCFLRKAASEILKLQSGRTATIESMVVTTFQNGDGSDVEVFMRVEEGNAFLFRRNICALDDDIQSSEILGWQIPEKLTVDMYVCAMRLQYFTSEEPRYATYKNELEEETKSKKAEISCNAEGQISVMMPTMKMSIQLEKPDDCRVPSPVVRALFGEPPFKLKGLTPVTTVRDPNIELCPWVQYVLLHSKQHLQIIATRQTDKEDVVPLSEAEIMEHRRPSRRQKKGVPEALQEVIKGIADWKEDFDGKGWKEFIQGIVDWSEEEFIQEIQLSIWKSFAAYIEEDSLLEDLKGALANTAKQIWEAMGCSTATEGVFCYICRTSCNQLSQFQDHCAGKKHWNKVKELQCEKKKAVTVYQ